MITNDDLQKFCDAVKAFRAEHGYQTNIVFERGRKNARIIVDEGFTRSVWCFVALDNGDIYKAAGWKAPAAHVRGNISKGTQGCTPYGPAYLR
jgi:hypothetical protein